MLHRFFPLFSFLSLDCCMEENSPTAQTQLDIRRAVLATVEHEFQLEVAALVLDIVAEKMKKDVPVHDNTVVGKIKALARMHPDQNLLDVAVADVVGAVVPQKHELAAKPFAEELRGVLDPAYIAPKLLTGGVEAPKNVELKQEILCPDIWVDWVSNLGVDAAIAKFDTRLLVLFGEATRNEIQAMKREQIVDDIHAFFGVIQDYTVSDIQIPLHLWRLGYGLATSLTLIKGYMNGGAAAEARIAAAAAEGWRKRKMDLWTILCAIAPIARGKEQQTEEKKEQPPKQPPHIQVHAVAQPSSPGFPVFRGYTQAPFQAQARGYPYSRGYPRGRGRSRGGFRGGRF